MHRGAAAGNHLTTAYALSLAAVLKAQVGRAVWGEIWHRGPGRARQASGWQLMGSGGVATRQAGRRGDSCAAGESQCTSRCPPRPPYRPAARPQFSPSKRLDGGAAGVEALAGVMDLGRYLVLRNADLASLRDPALQPTTIAVAESAQPGSRSRKPAARRGSCGGGGAAAPDSPAPASSPAADVAALAP